MNDTTAAEFDRRAAIARGAVRADFGEGWMTTGARDMVRIAAFAGFDVPELVQRVALATKHDGMTGPRLVERVMAENGRGVPAMTTPALTSHANQLAAHLRDARNFHDGEMCDALARCLSCRTLDLTVQVERRLAAVPSIPTQRTKESR